MNNLSLLNSVGALGSVDLWVAWVRWVRGSNFGMTGVGPKIFGVD